MKKIFALCVIFALVFAACGSTDDNAVASNSDVIGVWTGSGNNQYGGALQLKLEIFDGNWTLVVNNNASSYAGRWERAQNVLTLMLTETGYYYTAFATATLTSDGKLLFVTNNYASGSIAGTFELTKTVTPDDVKGDTTLKIKNESFTEITDVLWQDVSFANNSVEKSIKTGTTVTQNVQKGMGYIFFKRKTNPIVARTRELVTVEQKENKEFTFTDNTLIVEVNNPDNTGKLGALTSTVVFFDDAEGEMQQYAEKISFVGYYKTYSDLNGSYSSYYYKYHVPQNGQKSIAVGGTNSARLHLNINLSKKAKLSFWYANKAAGSADTTFSINSAVQKTWTNDIDWSYLDFELQPGNNDLIWEKKDGYNSGDCYYLSLDDILIYYK